MPTLISPIQELAQRIGEHEAELAKLRREFESRQTQLAQLTRRKAELQAQLQKVEAEIQAVSPAAAMSMPVTKPTTPAKLAASMSSGQPAKRVTLAQFLINCVKRTNKPLSSKELADEVVRRKYPTTSQNIGAMVDTRVQELVKKGLLRRAADRSGVVLGKTPANASSPTTEQKSNLPKAKSAEPNAKLSLNEVLTQVLTKSSRPLTTSELAEQVLKTGYETKSKDFKNVIWVGIGKMKNIKRIPGKGYQLKK